MCGIMTISRMPGQLDRETSEIDWGGKHSEARIAFKTAANLHWQGRAVVGDRDHLRDCKKMRYRDGNLPLKVVLTQSLEKTGTDPTGRKDVNMLQALILIPGKTFADVWVVRSHHAGKSIVHEMLHDEIIGGVNDPSQHHGGSP